MMPPSAHDVDKIIFSKSILIPSSPALAGFFVYNSKYSISTVSSPAFVGVFIFSHLTLHSPVIVCGKYALV